MPVKHFRFIMSAVSTFYYEQVYLEEILAPHLYWNYPACAGVYSDESS